MTRPSPITPPGGATFTTGPSAAGPLTPARTTSAPVRNSSSCTNSPRITNRITNIVANLNYWMFTNSTTTDWWTYIDCIHMSGPAFAKMAAISGSSNTNYAYKMYSYWHYTKSTYGPSNGLYNLTDHLWCPGYELSGQLQGVGWHHPEMLLVARQRLGFRRAGQNTGCASHQRHHFGNVSRRISRRWRPPSNPFSARTVFGT